MTPPTEPDLLDRDRELLAADGALEEAAGGRGQVLLIEGAPGMGKTRLWRATCSLASRRGYRVLAATSGELEQDLPFGVLRQLLSGAVADVADPAAAVVAALGLAGPASPLGSSDAAVSEATALEAVHGLCVSLLGSRPLLLAVDDAHWSDPASLKALLYLARRRADLPVAIALALRPEAMAPRHRALQLIAAQADVPLQPGPLSPEATRRFVTGYVGADCTERFAQQCWEGCGGNPLLLGNLLDEATAAGMRPDDRHAERVRGLGSVTVAEWALTRVRSLGPSAVAVAEAVAVLGPQATLPHVAALADVTAVEAETVLDDLVSAHVLSPEVPVAFVHPLVRSAVYRHIAAGLRSSRHRQAARLLAASGAPEDQVAAHLLSAAPTGDPWARAVLQQSGLRALSLGSPEAAVRLLRRAVQEDPAAASSRTLLQLGQTAVMIGDGQGADELAAACERAEREEDRVDAAVARGRILAFGGKWSTAIDLLSSTLSGVEDRERRLRLEAERLLLLESGDSTGASFVEEAERAGVGLTGATPGERLVMSHVASARLFRGAPRDEVLALTRMALADGLLLQENGPESPTWLYASGLLWVVGEYAAAEQELERGEAAARARGAGTAIAQVRATRAWIRFELGDLRSAEALSRGVLESGLLGFRSAGSRYARACLVTVLTSAGRLDEAEALLAEPHSGRTQDRFEALLAHARGELRLARGDAGGVDDLLAAGAWCEAHGIHNPGEWAWRTDVAPAMAAAGRVEEARALAEEDLDRARVFEADRPLGRALHAWALVGPPGERLPRLQEAVDVLRRSPARLALGHALVDLGAAQRSAGAPTQGRESWREALDLLDGCGAAPLAERAKRLLHAAGARPRRAARTGPAALTPAELEVCRLVVGGRSNREAAAEMFVSVKTVEKHLGNAYGKLGITRRADLASALASAPDLDSARQGNQ